MPKICDFQGCKRTFYAKGYCTIHYRQSRRGAKLHITPVDLTIEERLWRKTTKGPGCWLWQGTVGKTGYGTMTYEKKTHYVHRVAYEIAYGEIGKGRQVDHLCWNRRCVNPSHLRSVTGAQNMQNRRGPQSNSKSGIRGVFPFRGRWIAEARVNGTKYCLGVFDSIEQADKVASEFRRENLLFSRADQKPHKHSSIEFEDTQ